LVALFSINFYVEGLNMRLTTKGRFAVTAMIDLALRQHSGPVTLSAISRRQSISLSYLEQLYGKLRRHELVDSVRGPGGGYTLARLARNITVADIIFAVDEPIDDTNCGGKTDCASVDGRPSACMTHELWAALNRTMVDFLDSVSLQDLVDQQRMRQLQESGQTRTETSVKFPTSIDPAADPFARKAGESVAV
jgi:Rrf2 family transcriptional regulator, iron-sulfur cluster assembly transcription factor